jgi:hypothetical protein
MVLFQKPFSSGKTITKHQVRFLQNHLFLATLMIYLNTQQKVSSVNLLLTCLFRIVTSKVNYEMLKLYRALVTYTCNPSYLGGRDWEDFPFQASQANS